MTECPFCEVQKKMEKIMGGDIGVSIEPPMLSEETDLMASPKLSNGMVVVLLMWIISIFLIVTIAKL